MFIFIPDPAMTAADFAFILRKLGLAAALICALLSLAVFTVLLVIEHDPIEQAAVRALPLMVFALFGVFGAAMTRLIGRQPH